MKLGLSGDRTKLTSGMEMGLGLSMGLGGGKRVSMGWVCIWGCGWDGVRLKIGLGFEVGAFGGMGCGFGVGLGMGLIFQLRLQWG